jgi:hypothetical protein
MKWYWLSSNKMTISADVEKGVIIETAPVARKFVGQPIQNLIRWMRKQGGFRFSVKAL